MAILSFRRRPRKSSNPCRALMNSIQDEFLHLPPSIEKKIPFKKSRKNLKRKRMVRLARNTSISLPNLGDHQDHDQEPFLKESCAKLNSELKSSGLRKIKFVFERKVVLEINLDDQDQVMLQKENSNANLPEEEEEEQQQQQQQQQLPLGFKNYIEKLGATGDPVLVIQKKLFSSDVNSGLQRFSIPVKQVVNHGFLTEEERSRFHCDNKQEEIDALLIEPSLVQSRINFKKWYMDKSEIYVLLSGWNDVVTRNGLKLGEVVQLWSFKKGSQLYFALVRL